MQTQINFTPTEWAVISHRLGGAPDAIAEALTDHCEGEAPAVLNGYDEVLDCALDMDLEGPRLMIETELQKAVLLDACEGSTFFANRTREDEDFTKWDRAAALIERKIFAAFGAQVQIPRL